MKKLLLIFIMFGFIFNISLFTEEKDILIGLKLYKGKRVKADKTAEVVSSFSLKPMYSGKLIPGESYKKEMEEIKRIFHLTNISVMAETNWGWGKGEKRVHVFNVRINGKNFKINTQLDKKDTLKLEVNLMKGTKLKSLLKTGVILSQKKSMVIGFEDSEKKPYFLSIRRGKDRNIGYVKKKGSFWIKGNEIPIIKKYVKPVITEVIQKRGIGGFVVAIAILNTKGKVIGIEKLRGDSKLSKAVKDAVMQWEYNPFFIDGKAVPVKFTVGVEFNFKNDSRWIVRSTAEEKWKQLPSIWPVRGYITSGFGYRRNPFSGKKEFHRGIDIASALGTEIRATADGKIKEVGFGKKRGRFIIIDHQNGYETEFTHLLKEVYVKKGDYVKRGRIIAEIGKTGLSTGPHLHYEVRKNGNLINPLDFILK